MSEELPEDTAELLHMFGSEVARSLKRMEPLARDILILSKILPEAQRLQGIVAKLSRDEATLTAKLSRDEAALTAKLAVVTEQHATSLQQLDSVNGQLADNERLLDEARKGAQARIAEELDVWRERQLRARRQEIDGLMADTQAKHRAAVATLKKIKVHSYCF